MEEPILNAHNKAEFEPSHTDAFDTYPFWDYNPNSFLTL